jgi:hypothetical protein
MVQRAGGHRAPARRWRPARRAHHSRRKERPAIGGRIEHAVAWWIGGWWAYGEHRYGDRKALVESDDWRGPSFETCMDAARVCRKIKSSGRQEVLSFKHHAEVSALDPDEADALLDAAGRTHLPRRLSPNPSIKMVNTAIGGLIQGLPLPQKAP